MGFSKGLCSDLYRDKKGGRHVSSIEGDHLLCPAKRFSVSAGFIFLGIKILRNGRKLIFSLTKQFLIGNKSVYQNLQQHVKTVAM